MKTPLVYLLLRLNILVVLLKIKYFSFRIVVIYFGNIHLWLSDFILYFICQTFYCKTIISER